MKYSKEQLNEYLNKVIKAISDDKDILKGYLFGSYAENRQTEDSDIDLGFVVKDGLRLVKKEGQIRLYLYKNNLMDLETDVICLNDSYKLNDLFTIENEILKKGIMFYDQSKHN